MIHWLCSARRVIPRVGRDVKSCVRAGRVDAARRGKQAPYRAPRMSGGAKKVLEPYNLVPGLYEGDMTARVRGKRCGAVALLIQLFVEMAARSSTAISWPLHHFYY